MNGLLQKLTALLLFGLVLSMPVSAAGYRPLKFVLDAPIFRESEARAIAGQLKHLGIDVSVNVLTKAELRKKIRSGDRTAYLTDWGSAYFDPFDLALPKLATGGRGNFSFYSNPRVDELLANSVSETSIQQRKSQFHEVQRLIFEEVPWIFGYNLSNIEASSTNVVNFTPSGDNRINLHDIELKTGDTITVGMNAATFYTFDPAMHRSREAETVIRNMFDALVTCRKNGEVVPELAESWEIKNDVNYMFKLRKGVTFHDGSLMTADDVVFTFKRILSPGGIGGKSSPRKGLLGPLESVKKLDMDHVLFRLRSPFPPFLQALVHFQIVPGEYIRKVGDAEFARQPVGTGPFRYVAGTPVTDVVMERYDGYYGGAPDILPTGPAKIRQAVFRPVPDPSKRVSQLLSGNLSIIEAVPIDRIDSLSVRSGIKVASVFGTRSYQIELNNRIPPFNDKRVRKALNYAVDWDKILKQVYAGYGHRLATCFLRSGFGFDASIKPYPYNPELARDLIAQAGYSLVPLEKGNGKPEGTAAAPPARPDRQLLHARLKLDGAPKKVIIASSKGTAPFQYTDSNDVPVGMFIDIWRRWSEVTGIGVEFRPSSWNDTLENVRLGKADIHAGLYKSAIRDSFLDFGVPLYDTDTGYFFHKSILEVNDLEDLIPFRIGIIKGDFAVDFIRKRLPEASLAIYPDNKSLFDAVEAGEIKVFIKEIPIARYYLAKRRLFHEFRYYKSRPLYTNRFYCAVKEGNSRLLSYIRQGMDAISPDEKAAIQRKWMGVSQIKTRDTLTIALQDDYLPFSGLDFEGKPTGLLVDIWNLWSKKTGQRIEFKVGSRNMLPYMIEENEADIHAGLVPNRELKDRLSFSQPFYSVASNVFSRSPAKLEDLLASPAEKSLGVPSRTYDLKQLKQLFPRIYIRQYLDYQTMVKAALAGKLDYFLLHTAVALNLLDQLEASGQLTYSPRSVLVTKLHAAVRKNGRQLLDRINEGFGRIRNSELVEIEKRWLPLPGIRQLKEGSPEARLTKKEQQWLAEHREIRLGVDPDWPPFDYLGADGRTHKGMSADIITLLNKRLGINIRTVPLKTWTEVMKKARNRELDLLAAVVETESRRQYLRFTKPYLSFPWVIITRSDFEFVGSLGDLIGKRVAVVNEYATQERISEHYPQIRQQAYQNPLEGLLAVSTGKADAYVGNLATTSYKIQQHNISNLKVAAPTGLSNDMDHLRLGVRKDWPLLLSILNKGLSTITEEEANAIKRKWFAIRFEHGIDMAYVRSVVVRVGLVFVAILGFFLLWNRRLKAEVNRRVKVETELKKARDAAEEANRAKGTFLSNMSHEIRTPMNAILGFSQLLLRDESTSVEQKKTLRTIWRSGEHLLDLINDILEMSKIEAGRLKLNPESFDLYSLLDDLEMMFRVRTNAGGISLTFQRSDPVPRYIKTDRNKLRQILINLLGNAVKFTREGGVVLRTGVNPEQNMLTFEVEDSGPGIHENEIEKIFEQFEQTARGGKTEGGTGLGLAISRKLAVLLKGSIRVSSRVDEGSLFVLEIHFDPADAEEIAEKAAKNRVLRLKPGQETVRVLVVDDQPENRALMLKSLSDVGFQVKAASDGPGAIEQYQSFRPQLVLMDIVMPGMNGIEATERIRQLPGGTDCVVFAVTASVLEDEKEKILTGGAAEFIHKPYREADLFEKIGKHLGVQFEFEDRQPGFKEADDAVVNMTALNMEDIRDLPPELVEALYDAVTGGYTERLRQLIEQVVPLNAALAEQLAQLSQDYDYEKLMNFLDPKQRES